MHYLETSLSKYPKKTIIAQMKEHNFPIKLGLFNEEEDYQIKKYWLKFQQVNFFILNKCLLNIVMII